MRPSNREADIKLGRSGDGLVSSTIMVLFVIPVLFLWVRSWQHRKLVRE